MVEIDYTKVKQDLIVGYVTRYLKKQQEETKLIGKFKLSSSDQQLIHSLQSLRNVTDKYLDPNLLDTVLASIDLEKIYSGVDKRQAEGGNLGYDDYLVKELLHYFKHDFFTWVNKPKCSNCDTDLEVVNIGSQRFTGAANPDDVLIVEKYKCNKCSRNIEFPRINNPVSLLSSRKGRCGEWVNCFLLILLALINDPTRIRYIWNFEDHVWVEYYSTTLERWIHLDPCEAAFDEPLLYADNWGKQMSWVVGFGHNYIIDLSTKYITKEKQISLAKFNRKAIAAIISSINYEKIVQAEFKDLSLLDLSPGEKYLNIYYKFIVPRNQVLALLNHKDSPSKTDPLLPRGRQTGAGDWTKDRGEDGQ